MTAPWSLVDMRTMTRSLVGAAFGVLIVALTSCEKGPGVPPPASAASSSASKVAATADTTVLSVNLGSPAPDPCASSPKPPCLEPYSGPQDVSGAKSFLVLLDAASAPDGLSEKAVAQVIDGNVVMLQVATSQSAEHVISIFKLLVSKWGEPHQSNLDREWALVLQGNQGNKELFKTRVWSFSNLRVTYDPFPTLPGSQKGWITFETPRWQTAKAVNPENAASNPSKRF